MLHVSTSRNANLVMRKLLAPVQLEKWNATSD